MVTRPHAALYLTPRLPWPPDDGGRIVALQNLLMVADEFETTLISFAPPGPSPSRPNEVSARGIRVVTVRFHPPTPWAAAVRGIVGKWPYSLARYRSATFDSAIRNEIARRRPAFAYVQNLHLATYVDAFGGVPMVLREQNVEHLWMKRYADAGGATPRALYARTQTARLRRAESELCSRAALVLAIQDEERRAVQAMAPQARVEHLAVGVDVASFPPREPAEPPIVLLAASFAWPPNTEGALEFIREGWPRLRSRAPHCVLRVAGKEPPPSLRDAAERADGVELAANVPSMAAEYARATLLLVPLWVGGGARVKIIEAAAAGLPVVSTSIGAEGLGLAAGREIEIAETPVALADAAVDLLVATERRERLGKESRAAAIARWSLEAVAARQSELLRDIVVGTRRP